MRCPNSPTNVEERQPWVEKWKKRPEAKNRPIIMLLATILSFCGTAIKISAFGINTTTKIERQRLNKQMAPHHAIQTYQMQWWPAREFNLKQNFIHVATIQKAFELLRWIQKKHTRTQVFRVGSLSFCLERGTKTRSAVFQRTKIYAEHHTP